MGCTKTLQQQGCYLQTFDLKAIHAGKDTKDSIRKKYGPPSTFSIFSKQKGVERWFYTYRLLSEAPVKGRSPILHTSIVLTFDERGFVKDKAMITGENKVHRDAKTTKEAGYKTSFLKETFQNIGRFGQSGSIQGP
ncbi:hypothetical protein AGMMS49949_07400 [Alphaproteobacteria bacterium]|nr:hypothetical protein AGMMS49949_07400 [Alphaproteobacteria bacterium]